MYIIVANNYDSGEETLRLTDSIESAFRIFEREIGALFIDFMFHQNMKIDDLLVAELSVNDEKYEGIPAPSDSIIDMIFLVEGFFSVELKEVEVE